MKVGTFTALQGSKTTITGTSVVTTPNQPSNRTIISQNSREGDHKKPNTYSYALNDKTTYVGAYRVYRPSPYVAVSNMVLGANGNFPVDIINLGPSQADAYNLALSRLIDELRGSVDLSVTFFEFQQTKRMLNLTENGTIRNMAKILRQLKEIGFGPRGLTIKDAVDSVGIAGEDIYDKRNGSRKSLTPAGRSLKQRLVQKAKQSMSDDLKLAGLTAGAAADLWLEWNYGWRPLLQDAHDVIELVVYDNLPNKMKINASAKLPYPKTLKRAQGLGLGVTGYQEEVIFESSSRTSCRISCDVGPRLELSSTLATFTSLNPASIAWEATPYSFVVDWFVNIGGFLRNLESLYIYKSVISNVVITEIRACKAQILINDKRLNASVPQMEEKRFASIVKQVAFSRGVVNSLPIPIKPQIRMDMGWRRIITASALLAQLLK